MMKGLYIGIHIDLSDPKWKEVLDKARVEYDEVVDIRFLYDNKIYDFSFEELVKRVTQ